MPNITNILKRGVIYSSLLSVFCMLPTSGYCADYEEWTFKLAPYGWLAGQNGQVGTLPGLPAADIDVNFYDDIAGNINGALMLVGEAQKGDFGIKQYFFCKFVFNPFRFSDFAGSSTAI